jgi:molybdopterin-guanine dinucleotide biosynthesis protein A
MVVPCDAPQIPRMLVARLADAVNSRGALAACARTDGRLQAVFCLLATSLGTSLADYLVRGGSAVQPWLAEVGAVTVDFEDAYGFRSIDTPDALAGGLR